MYLILWENIQVDKKQHSMNTTFSSNYDQNKHRRKVNTFLKPRGFDHAQLVATIAEKAWQ